MSQIFNRNPHRELPLICVFPLTGSGARLPEPSDTSFRHLWRPPGPRGRSRPARFSLRQKRNNARPSTSRKGLAGTGGVESAEQAGCPGLVGAPPPGARGLGLHPRRVLRPTCGAIRRGWAAAGDVPSALPEPVSTAAARTGAAKVGPPEPSSRGPERPGHRPGSSRDWRRLRHARGGAAAGGGRSRKRKRRSEWGVGPSRSRILGDDASL